ncbi:SDR family NAD(P)-dependent oxidoreductase [Nocardiopsis algeriensis]|uniref:NAD(P)-dependent dehydrogenase (Short-subunit alcohol dehydrogenase family) n=1 Tax=Nocardiopsis algeriensis TaxID=1478215 RepID=A0A841IYJ2_9ACTN|nr:SDR family oxidoreductase [Nocardiopsis algeriensis]MBB6121298.1 NAD(P)-dependent dehydrogenase (short-subunit alcohol dehydrogenase family) [Nocardiopsis algeriensis]
MPGTAVAVRAATGAAVAAAVGTGLMAAAGVAVGAGAVALALRSAPARLTGRVALVTGGSRGLGLQMARELGDRGARVAVCARDTAELDQAVADLRSRGVDALGIRCDLRDPGQIEDMVAQAVAHFGHLDIVVNNAGIIQVGPQEVFDESHFQDAMDTMFWAPLRVSRAALGHLEATGGTLVNITSIGGHLSVPHLLPYSCAKFAETALSEGLAAEVARTGVKVTTVVPGLMRTGSHRAAVFSGRAEYEHAWFSLFAGLPLVSTSAERAARRIVEAAARGRSYVILTPLARAVVLARGVSPALVQTTTRVMGRMLPSAPEEVEEQAGKEAGRGVVNRVLRLPTALNERAAGRLNQQPRTNPG